MWLCRLSVSSGPHTPLNSILENTIGFVNMMCLNSMFQIDGTLHFALFEGDSFSPFSTLRGAIND